MFYYANLTLDVTPREYERLFDRLERADLEEIYQISGCKKPCQYRKYKIVSQHLTSFESDFFLFSLVAVSKKIIVETEQLIYPLSSLVAEFGGTLGSEWKIFLAQVIYLPCSTLSTFLNHYHTFDTNICL